MRFDVVNVFDNDLSNTETAAGLAYSLRNMVRGAATSSASKRNCRGPNNFAALSLAIIRAIMRVPSNSRPLLSPSTFQLKQLSIWSQRGGAFGVNTMSASGGGGPRRPETDSLAVRRSARLSDRAGCLGFYEADYDASTQDRSLPADLNSGASRTPWFATLRGRVEWPLIALWSMGQRATPPRSTVNRQHPLPAARTRP